MPNTCSNHEDLKKTFLVFDGFEKARTAMQQELHKLAFSKNAMFDGAGRMKMLKKYYNILYHEEIDETEYRDDALGPTGFNELQNILLAIFNGEKVQENWHAVTMMTGLFNSTWQATLCEC